MIGPNGSSKLACNQCSYGHWCLLVNLKISKSVLFLQLFLHFLTVISFREVSTDLETPGLECGAYLNLEVTSLIKCPFILLSSMSEEANCFDSMKQMLFMRTAGTEVVFLSKTW